MKLYLASSFDYAHICEAVRKVLESKGHVIPDVWWNIRAKDDFTSKSDGDFYDSPIMRAIAARHWKTIDECDGLVLVTGGDPEKTFTGANVEVGYAVAKGKPVFSLGLHKRSAMYVPLIRCADITELAEAIAIVGGKTR